MAKAPGHRKWPDHEVREERLGGRVRVEANGEVVADSTEVIRLHEDDHPVRHYFPRSDVEMDRLESSDREAHCPFKGDGRYFHLAVDDVTLDDVAWSYEDVYEEHHDLKDRVAFHDRERSEIEIRPAE